MATGLGDLTRWLDDTAKFLHRRFFLLGPAILSLGILMVLTDSWLHWIAAMIPSARIENLGRIIGKAAFYLGFVATLYYGVRDIFVTARRMKLMIPDWLDFQAKYWITVLRLAHPFLGTLVFSVVLLHGYVMWKVWAGGNFTFAVETGQLAAAILVLVAISGLFIRWMPKMMKLRHVHRLVGISFLLAFVLHRITN